MRTPRLSEIDLTVADDVSVVAMVPVPGPHPTAHTVPCNTSERAGPRRGLRVYFNNRVVRSRRPVAPSQHTERAGVGRSARAALRAISKDRPTERPGRGENSGTRRGEHADHTREP